jgi:hypothetical protein
MNIWDRNLAEAWSIEWICPNKRRATLRMKRGLMFTFFLFFHGIARCRLDGMRIGTWGEEVWCCGARRMVLGCSRAMVPGCAGAAVPWCPGEPVPRCLVARVNRCHCALSPGCTGAMVHRRGAGVRGVRMPQIKHHHGRPRSSIGRRPIADVGWRGHPPVSLGRCAQGAAGVAWAMRAGRCRGRMGEARRALPGSHGRGAQGAAGVAWAMRAGRMGGALAGAHGRCLGRMGGARRALPVAHGRCAQGAAGGAWAMRAGRCRRRLLAGRLARRLGAWHVALAMRAGRCRRRLGAADVACRLGAWHVALPMRARRGRCRPCAGVCRHPSAPLDVSLGIRIALDPPINLSLQRRYWARQCPWHAVGHQKCTRGHGKPLIATSLFGTGLAFDERSVVLETNLSSTLRRTAFLQGSKYVLLIACDAALQCLFFDT